MINTRYLGSAVSLCLLLVFTGCSSRTHSGNPRTAVPAHPAFKPLPPNSSPQLKQLVDGAVAQAGVTTGYDPSYVSIRYPDGDVPINTGVCSDVVVRAFRKAGIDLQKEVHEDMARGWDAYPKRWG